jgi:glycosyltransferase involved in cell wall biosynthesis
MKKVSIITICLNEKNNIEKTIKSVIDQNCTNFEYLVIDGGSTDGTAKIISKYGDKLSYFVSEKDSGIYSAMNKGIEHSNGEYLLFLNGGDYLSDINILSNFINKDFNEDIIYGNLFLDNKKKQKIFKNIKIDNEYLFNNYISHPSTFIKKDLFDKYGLYNEKYKIAGDYEFFLRVIIKYKATCRYFDEGVSVYNTNGISSQSKYSNLQIAERRKAQLGYFNKSFLFKKMLLKIKRVIFSLFNID